LSAKETSNSSSSNITTTAAKNDDYQQQSESRIYLVTEGNKSPHTAEAYRLAFNRFLKVTINIDSKYDDLNALRVLLDYKPSVIESKIIDHIIHLRDGQKLSYWSLQVHCAAIFHFFVKMNDVNLNTRKIKRFLPQDESDHYSNDRPYSPNEISQIMSKCDIRSKVVILLMVSTGVRIGSLFKNKQGMPGLRLGDIKKIEEFGLYMIWVYSWSKADRYYTFCTPECAAAIDAYLDYRKSFGEELKDKSPLIREQFNIDNPFTVQAPKFLSQRMMTFMIEDLLKRSGVNPLSEGQKRRLVMRSHGFRKFFITQCDKVMNFTVREYLSGHRLPNQDRSYIKTTEEDRLAEYVKAIPLLTIMEREKQSLQKRVKELESERITKQDLEEIRRQWMIDLQKERALISLSEWNALKEQMNKLKDILYPQK
jgi:integrase